jgi:hypothetical protein
VARRFFQWRDGEFVELGVKPLEATTTIITDSLPPGGLWHPATGTFVDSKSKFRQYTKAAGCVEVGNEVQRDTRQWGVPDLKGDIVRTMERTRRGR